MYEGTPDLPGKVGNAPYDLLQYWLRGFKYKLSNHEKQTDFPLQIDLTTLEISGNTSNRRINNYNF